MNHPAIFVINLARSVARRRAMKRQFAGTGLTVTWVSACDGHDEAFPFHLYEDLAGQWWDRYDEFKPGAFGCFLSHAKVWARVALGREPHATVLEDDIEFDSAAWRSCVETISATAFDIVFINDQVQQWVRHVEESGKAERLIEMAPLLCRLVTEGTWRASIPAPGTQGYIVSRQGACKLLFMMHSRGINMGVDYALLLNTLNREHLERLGAVPSEHLPFSVRTFLSNEKRRPPSEAPVCLNGYIYAPAWIAKHHLADSTIGHELYLSNDVFSAAPKRRLPSPRILGRVGGRPKRRL